MMNNACPSRITAAAGTKLAGTKLLKTKSLLVFTKVVYKACRLLRTINIAGSDFRPLSKIPHCCLRGVWAVFQSQCG